MSIALPISNKLASSTDIKDKKDIIGGQIKLSSTEPALTIINQELRNNNNLTNPDASTTNFNPRPLFRNSETRTVDPSQLNKIVNSYALNDANCYAINMLKIFTEMAVTVQTNSEWQDQMTDLMAKINSFILQLAEDLQKYISDMQKSAEQAKLKSMQTAGIIGLLTNIATLVVGIAMCIPAPTPVGVLLIANSIVQGAGSMGKIADPEGALKDNSWQNSLSQNGVFSVFDKVLGENGGQIVQTLVSIAMIVLSDGASLANAVANKAALTAEGEAMKVIASRVALLIDDLVKVVGLVGGLCMSKSSDPHTAKMMAFLSMGAFGGGTAALIEASASDDDSTAQICASVIGAALGVASQVGLRYGGNSQIEAAQNSKFTKYMREVDSVYNLQNQAKNINVIENRMELALRNNSSKQLEAEYKELNKKYETCKALIEYLVKLVSQYNDELLQAQSGEVELIKKLEQTFMSIFNH